MVAFDVRARVGALVRQAGERRTAGSLARHQPAPTDAVLAADRTQADDLARAMTVEQRAGWLRIGRLIVNGEIVA